MIRETAANIGRLEFLTLPSQGRARFYTASVRSRPNATQRRRKGDLNRQSLSLALPGKPSIAVVPFIKCDR